MKKRKCQECSIKIIGRTDKKFCSDYCRNSFNNRLKKDSNNYIRNINNILRKNRRILKEFNPGGKSEINEKKLLNRGFNFDYYTNTYRTKTGKIYYYCYEYGYLQVENNFYALVVKKDHVDN